MHDEWHNRKTKCVNSFVFFPSCQGTMAGAGERKGKKDDNGIGTAIDFVLSNARLVLGVGGAAMLGIATLAVKRVRVVEGEMSLEGGAVENEAFYGILQYASYLLSPDV